MGNTLKYEIALLVKEKLKEKGFDSFIGGSYRFGYETLGSDIDLFLNANGETADSIFRKIEDMFMGMLKEIFNAHAKTPYNNKGYILQVELFNFIHLNFYEGNEFFCLQMEHAVVEEFLNKNPILRELRGVSNSGTEFYKKIKELATKK